MDECSCGSDCLICEGCGLPECECACDGEKEKVEEMTHINDEREDGFGITEEDEDGMNENAIKEEDLGLVLNTEDDSSY